MKKTAGKRRAKPGSESGTEEQEAEQSERGKPKRKRRKEAGSEKPEREGSEEAESRAEPGSESGTKKQSRKRSLETHFILYLETAQPDGKHLVKKPVAKAIM